MSGMTWPRCVLQTYVPSTCFVMNRNQRHKTTHIVIKMLTNFPQVSEFAEENEMRDLFERFGRVTRVFLAKDRDTGRAKGFAFVSFQERSDAGKALEKLDGFGYHHLILKVEFAKKTT